MGRPKGFNGKCEQYRLRLSQEENYILKKLAEKEGLSKAEVLRKGLKIFNYLSCVLMDEYWKKSYAQKLPGFTDKVIEYYEAWQDGKLSLDEIKDKLWKYGGVRLKAEKVMV